MGGEECYRCSRDHGSAVASLATERSETRRDLSLDGAFRWLSLQMCFD